jgi:predicted PurR-regulated permease PerM
MEAPRQIARALAGYVKGELTIIGVQIVLYALGMALLRVPLWPLWAILAGAVHPVPLAGSIFGLIVPLYCLWLVDAEMWRILAAIGVFVFVQTLEGFYLTPKILGRHLGLSPMTVFFCVLAGGFLFGPLGMLLAAPVAAIAAIVWKATRPARSP